MTDWTLPWVLVSKKISAKNHIVGLQIDEVLIVTTRLQIQVKIQVKIASDAFSYLAIQSCCRQNLTEQEDSLHEQGSTYLIPTTTLKSSSSDRFMYFWKLNLVELCGAKCAWEVASEFWIVWPKVSVLCW